MPEIAELAGVRRPVVTTWRRRYPDFPAPEEADGGTPLFDARRVVDWLVKTGRAERPQIEADLRLYTLTSLVTHSRSGAANGRRRDVGPSKAARELVGAITALICLRHLDDDLLRPDGYADRHVIAALRERAADVDPDDDLLRAEVDALPADAAWLAAAVDELIEAAWGCRQAYERILAARTRFGVPELAADAVHPAVATLVAGLSGAREHADLLGGVRVADPAAGAGDLLVAVLDRLGEEADASVVAAEADPFLARLLRRRLTVRGLAEADLVVHNGPPPSSAQLEADVLVTRMPYLPKEKRDGADPLALVRRLTDALSPGQTAVVAGPAELLVSALPPYQPAARTRNQLLADGRVEAVIALPGGLVPYRPAYQTALWVLRREDPSPWRGRVLLADVSDRPLTDRVVDELVWDVTTWRRDGHRPDQHLRAHASQVAVADLLRPRVPLTTRRPRRLSDLTAPQRLVAQVVELEAELDGSGRSRTAPPLRSGLAVRDEPAPLPRRTIGALVRDGYLTLGKGARLAPEHVVADGHHPVIGAPELTGARPIGSRTLDRATLARYPRLKLTEPGDVIVTLTPQLGVHLDRDGFAVVEFPARVLRIPEDARHLLTPAVLAAVLSALPHVGQPTTRAASAVRAPARLVDLQIPLLPPDQVERLDGLLAAAEVRREQARREMACVDELCRIATAGLVDGTLTIAGASGARRNR